MHGHRVKAWLSKCMLLVGINILTEPMIYLKYNLYITFTIDFGITINMVVGCIYDCVYLSERD